MGELPRGDAGEGERSPVPSVSRAERSDSAGRTTVGALVRDLTGKLRAGGVEEPAK